MALRIDMKAAAVLLGVAAVALMLYTTRESDVPSAHTITYSPSEYHQALAGGGVERSKAVAILGTVKPASVYPMKANEVGFILADDLDELHAVYHAEKKSLLVDGKQIVVTGVVDAVGVLQVEDIQPAQLDGMSDAALGQPLPTLALFDAAGKKKNLSSISGNKKVMLVNIFASWCGPCAEEMPELKKLKEKTGVAMYGVAWNDTPSTLKEWFLEHGNPFDDVWYDNGGVMAKALSIDGVPQTFVIDAQGVVRKRMKGAVSPAQIQGTLLPLIERLQEDEE